HNSVRCQCRHEFLQPLITDLRPANGSSAASAYLSVPATVFWLLHGRFRMEFEVGLAKIMSFKQDWCLSNLSDRVGKTVSHIQPCRMTALAEFLESLFCRTIMGLIKGNRC